MLAALGLGLLGDGLVAGAVAKRPANATVAGHVSPAIGHPTPPPGPVIAAAPIQLPSQPATVATANVPSLPIFPSPMASNAEEQLANPNNLGAPLVLLAVAIYPGWVQTYLPQRPNESLGWVPDTDVTLTQDPYHISVSLGARLLTLYDGDVPVFQASVAPGEPSSPTPTGSFYVTEVLKLTDPTSAYGPFALGTSGFSNTYYSFDGGPGQVALHGTNQPGLIGGYASHGCVRLTNAEVTALAMQTPPGTPVEIGP